MKGLQATERGFPRTLNNEDLEVWFQKTINMTEIKRKMCQWVGQNERHAQIGILVPIEPQRRTNGTSGTGSSIKHLKAVPFKTKKAPKRGNFHSPM